MSRPFITVYTCAYNAQEYISESISSILHQTYTNFEYIIVDDGSTDSTPNLIDYFAKKDKRIKVVSQRNMGISIANNKAKELAKGKYVAIQDADDISMPNRLTKQVKFLEANPNVKILGGSLQIIDENGLSTGKIWRYPTKSSTIAKVIPKCYPFGNPSVMYNRKSTSEYWFNPSYRRCTDYEIWSRFIADGYLGANLPDVLVQYRINKWQSKVKLTLANTIKIQERFITSHPKYNTWENRFLLLCQKLLYTHYNAVFATIAPKALSYLRRK